MRDVLKGIASGYTCEPNLAELYYKTYQKLGRDTALIRYTSLRHAPLIIAAPDAVLSRVAGELKCASGSRLSLADAYIVAQTKRVRGSLYTTDSRIADLRIVPTRLIELE